MRKSLYPYIALWYHAGQVYNTGVPKGVEKSRELGNTLANLYAFAPNANWRKRTDWQGKNQDCERRKLCYEYKF